MIEEEHLGSIHIYERPFWQILTGYMFLIPNYNFPPKTTITVENIENIPADQSVIFAMNHTDRYNYWPFQLQIYREGVSRFTTTWVKGKYYENPVIKWFFDRTNNIPLPSMGYLLVKDFIELHDHKPDDDEYRLVRDYVEDRLTKEELLEKTGEDVNQLFTEIRRDYHPDHESYREYMNRLHSTLSALVEKRSLEAMYNQKNHLLVFPEGTRSIQLQRGHTGIAEFALKHNIPILPVGCNGSDQIYPGNLPVARGGEVVYRVGELMTPDDEFSDLKIDRDYVPFTYQARDQKETFQEAADRVTQRINGLLDSRHQMTEETRERTSTDRLI